MLGVALTRTERQETPLKELRAAITSLLELRTAKASKKKIVAT